MGKVIRLAMIGCGGNAQGHLRAFDAHPEVQVVALVDPVKAMLDRSRRTVGALADVPAFADPRAMLK
ncbi:hypothetical protein LCGC14_2657200, partial [marine sediment metagenome]